MVVQRGMPVHLWGNADPHETVTARFQGTTATVTTDEFGLWSLYLPTAKVGGPYVIDVIGTNAIRIQDVLVGDIWLASGQSNMEFYLKDVQNSQAEIPGAQQPRIRLLQMQHATSDYPLDRASTSSWKVCTPDNIKEFSAVAYFFARKIQEDQSVPIGMVESAWGGTPVEAWTSLQAISADGSLMPILRLWARMAEAEPSALLKDEKTQRDFDAAKAMGKNADPPSWRNGFRAWGPGYLFNAMIAPLTRMPICGVIWYQGESNTDSVRSPLYAQAFQTLIADWRERWGEGDFPFLFVQLADFVKSDTDSWATVRNAQLQTLSVRNTAMVVTNDIGNPENVHPTNKQDVGARLALAARAVAYGETIEYSGPLFRSATPGQGYIRVSFDHISGGLILRARGTTGFEIAGSDGRFVPAQARVEGDSLVLSTPEVQAPEHVRCGWSKNQECNLYNGAGLPSAPFISN
jgi:sialate O-acetylesterase